MGTDIGKEVGGREKQQDLPYLFVSLQLLHEGPLVEESVQALLCVVVAQVLKGCAALAFRQPRVLEARGVHDEQGAQGMLAGFQGPAATPSQTWKAHKTHWHRGTAGKIPSIAFAA